VAVGRQIFQCVAHIARIMQARLPGKGARR
jgi:hypothetical protein